ncbi:MAG: hypothetical protein KF760_05985 [Candidatus Eremiobacteraeota bacterium]|nr:hypothetical protein [Candidatus Eremiobacteraeota bacterium]MCW5867056.1 hypothetical protein [Candidatus Eremiobacteraeota bacterium]
MGNSPEQATRQPALLFTFYRNPDTCAQRILCLRHLNPGLPIHGLFTGSAGEEEDFSPVRELLDSFYEHPVRAPEWLWSNYDLVISRWFQEQGRHFAFDYLWVHSWDLLLLDPLDRFVPQLEPDEVLLPGLRPLQQMDERVLDPLKPSGEVVWTWLREPEFLQFVDYWREHYGGPLWCEVSPFGVLGREVCRRYAEACWTVPGHNEYRFPSLAAALGARLRQGGFSPQFWRNYEPNRKPWTLKDVLRLAAEPPGQRLCHPFYYPISPAQLQQRNSLPAT